MSNRITKHEWNHLAWLHVYGQWFYHSEARIRGTREGLTALRDALNAALETGAGSAEVIAHDGEGYHVEVQRVNTHAALGSPEYIYEAEYEAGRREMERVRRHRAKYQRTAQKAEASLPSPIEREEGV